MVPDIAVEGDQGQGAACDRAVRFRHRSGSAAAAAKNADVAIVFAYQWESEGMDLRHFPFPTIRTKSSPRWRRPIRTPSWCLKQAAR